MNTITHIKAEQILDSRNNPTLEVCVTLDEKSVGCASVPSGASTGAHEALELRDGTSEYQGMGVTKALHNVNEIIAKATVGKMFDQKTFDETLRQLDGTENKSSLGANALLGASCAFAKAAAIARQKELYAYIAELYGLNKPFVTPLPMANILNGGKHAPEGADVQEIMAVPINEPSFEKGRKKIENVFGTLKKLLEEKNLSTTLGDEGGFAPSFASNKEALELLTIAIQKAGYVLGNDMAIALDVAATSLYKHDEKTYDLQCDDKKLTAQELLAWYQELAKTYSIISIEDPFYEEAWADFQTITAQMGASCAIIGDDLFVTNPSRIQQGIEQKAANGAIIKPNQIGTLSETLEAIAKTENAGWRAIASHRSGETNDTLIADIAVGCGIQWIKIGAPSRPERIAKYDRLQEIENQIKKQS